MPTTFGITPVGFVLKSIRDILDEENAELLSDISASLDTSPMSPDGQRNAINARQEGALWEILNTIYDMLDPEKAEDNLLISLCKLTGTVPSGATYTIVAANCALVAGTTLVADDSFAAIAGNPKSLFTPVADFVAPSTGTFSVKFRAQTPGPVPCNAGTLNVISTSVTGWTGITNPLDGKLGSPADTNETLRLKRANELAAAGASTVDGIRADVLQFEDTDGNQLITTCQVNENPLDAVDVNGVPGHAVECIVVAPITTTNDQIAQAIFDTKGGGINSYGANVGTAIDEQGKTYLIHYSTPIDKPVYLIFDLDTNSDYVGDAAFAAAVATSLTAQVQPGDDVLVWACQQAANQPGVTNLHSVKLGFGPAPSGTADLVITVRERATFDSSRVSVV